MRFCLHICNYRQGKLRGLQLALVCGAEMHLKVNLEMEKIKRDKMMGLLMMRNKVSREEWLLEAMIVALELYQTGRQPPSSLTFITRSDGMRCAVRELRGLSEVRISESAQPPPAPVSGPSTEPKKPSVLSRDSSCPPATGWRSRMLREEQEQEQTDRQRAEERRKEQEQTERQRAEERRKEKEMEERRRTSDIKERKVIRVRRTSDRRKRLDTINSESEYSVGLYFLTGNLRFIFL